MELHHPAQNIKQIEIVPGGGAIHSSLETEAHVTRLRPSTGLALNFSNGGVFFGLIRRIVTPHAGLRRRQLRPLQPALSRHSDSGECSRLADLRPGSLLRIVYQH